MTRSFSRRVFSIIVSIMIVFAFMPLLGQDAYAAAKKPGTPKITSVQVNANTVSLKWGKAKNAKKYRVFVQTGGDGWKYWRSVKATKQNKKKYSDKLKYKLKKSGKKYKVYKKKNPYKLVRTTTARKYTYTGKYSTTYRFVVRAVNGKKAGAYSAAKAAKTGAKPKPPADTSQPDPGNDPGSGGSGDSGGGEDSGDGDAETPATVPAPGQVSNLKAEVSIGAVTSTSLGGTYTITVTWDAAKDATSYDVYRKTGVGAAGTSYVFRQNRTDCKYTLTKAKTGTIYSFKIIPKNGDTAGNPSEIQCTTPAEEPSVMDIEVGEFDSWLAWDQYLAKMLGYYKQELQKQGISINSTDKADEFKKLRAIIQVMHDYVGYSERITSDYSNFPTGRVNWQYNDTTAAIAGTNTNGNYYNGKDYIPTIEFYGSCDTISETQEYLAQQAGLDEFQIGRTDYGHIYAMICANNVWYNADPGWYMAPGPKGLGYNSPIKDPSKFQEASYNIEHSLSIGTTFDITNIFKLSQVFYGMSSKSVQSDGSICMNPHNGHTLDTNGNILVPGNKMRISSDKAYYTSSDESILSFENDNGTCTFHKTGFVYVTIAYENQNSEYKDFVPSYTTTISVKVTD